MWQRAVDRQYNLFGTLLIFLVTALTIVGSIIAASRYNLSCFEKTVFSIASVALFASVLGLLRMTSIERSVAYKAEPPKNADHKLQNEENIWRRTVYVATTITVFLILLLVNSVIWKNS